MTQHEIDQLEIDMLRKQRDSLIETLKAIRDHLVNDNVAQVLNVILDKCEKDLEKEDL